MIDPSRSSTAPIPIDSLDDLRIAGYRNLRERTLRGESIFLTEGITLTERLLASRFAADSVVAEAAHVDRLLPQMPGDIPLYVVSRSLIEQIAGFKFHRGVLALGRRQPWATLGEILEKAGERFALFGCPETTCTENLGLIYRTAAALKLGGVLLGEKTSDPFCRHTLRVSMGGIFTVPSLKSTNLVGDIERLQQEYGVQVLATVLDPAAEALHEFTWPDRSLILLGQEYYGLGEKWLEQADHRITIPMPEGVDSLNVGVAAGIFAYSWALAGQS